MRNNQRQIKEISKIEQACYPDSVLDNCERAVDTIRQGAKYKLYFINGLPVAYSIVEIDCGHAYIADLAVLPGQRCNRTLWHEIIQWFKQVVSGCGHVTADCRKSSQSIAIRLLSKNGYNVKTRDDHDYYPDEVVTCVSGITNQRR